VTAVSPTKPIGRSWKNSREIAAQRKAEEHASQAWRPGCLCGAMADTVMPAHHAERWLEAHRLGCGLA
jgi:hypothetical protein